MRTPGARVRAFLPRPKPCLSYLYSDTDFFELSFEPDLGLARLMGTQAK
jgi:hypothetical protein